MVCILLAAGYATRLYPLTENMPKALLPLGKKTILDTVVDKIEQVKDIEDIYIVTNDRFYEHFKKWADDFSGTKRVGVLNDFTTDNSNRLGAIGDLQYTVTHYKIDDEILVMASDNIFDFSLNDFVKLYREKNSDTICVNRVDNTEELRTMGVAELDGEFRVVGFEEKPKEPKTNIGVSPFYLYKRETVPMIKEYLDEGNNKDAPGNFIPWLINKKPVYAFITEGMRIDIGTPDSYKEAQRLFESQ
ncbi:MAG: nucleotidyltransferase family protein [Oscillospiraceae bacterium]|nr:nucleotidyltransferase family protein [Oscillospiraceae bacterium]